MAIVPDTGEGTRDERTNLLPPQGPRGRWAGVMSGFFVAIGVLMLMGALGLAIGVTALGDPREATGETASGLGIAAGVWAFITMLVALFLGGMVSTTVTDRPDRPGALIHGLLVWVLFSLFTAWMIASGISLGFSGLFGALSGLTRGTTTAIAAARGDLVQALGLNDPNRVMDKLDAPATASTLAAATGMSPEEARAAIENLRARVQAVRDDPARVAAEVREFLAQYTERAKQQALVAAATAQRGAKLGSWMTFGILVVGVGVSIAGAMGGVPMSKRRKALRKDLEDAGFELRSPFWKYGPLGAVIGVIMIQLAINIWVGSQLPADKLRWFAYTVQAVSPLFAIGALFLGLLQWYRAREEISMDKFHERLDRANERLNAMNIAREKKPPPSPLPSWHAGTPATYEMIAYVFTELDNLEYAIEKHRLGYMHDELASRALNTFRNRCSYPKFRELALDMVGVGQVGYSPATKKVVKKVCEQKATIRPDRPPLVEVLDL
jgi:hypothetical protein